VSGPGPAGNANSSGLLDGTRAALGRARQVYQGTEAGARLGDLARRLDDVLRVAVAGRVKAGKSTLLNALVGERLAPTDAGECTQVVTWYRDGHTYQVLAHPIGGAPRQLRFAREDGALEFDLDGLSPAQIGHVEVTWPSQALRTATLIDTPGIGSISGLGQRSWELLAAEDEETPADAVVYLMRHLHAGDLEFLRAFHDTEVSQPNPVNAIGVLSRADEVGVCRLDAMTSARRIAARMATDPSVRRVVQTVVPVAGLLAETAASLTEAEVAQLRKVALLEPRDTEALLLTVDRFANQVPELGLTGPEREQLLDRLGLFGVRLAVSLLRRGTRDTTATQLAAQLAARSGVRELRDLLGSLFFERREVLKSRSALLALDTLTRTQPRPGSDRVAAEVEGLISSAHPFRELRVLAAVRAGWVTGKPEVLSDLERLIGGTGGAAHVRLQQPPDASPAALAKAATEALARWRRRAENPVTRPELASAARVVIRSCEGILLQLRAGR
jgi:hypothetical protein